MLDLPAYVADILQARHNQKQAEDILQESNRKQELTLTRTQQQPTSDNIETVVMTDVD